MHGRSDAAMVAPRRPDALRKEPTCMLRKSAVAILLAQLAQGVGQLRIKK